NLLLTLRNCGLNTRRHFTYAYNRRGSAYRVKDEFDNAIRDYNTAIQIQPDDPYVYNRRGKAYREKGEFDNAIRDYNTAIQIQPDYTYAYYNLGITWLRLQEWEKAKSDLTTAQNMGVDIITSFHNDYVSVADFEQKTDIQLPPDIAEMLTPK
ncbi:MAG: tetratricopeptide repeat protein, partial [Candidatus Poribacteria bacterium]|nr:tetratricopeptide repeat protein [Candidatus Poribacteria bacterium]